MINNCNCAACKLARRNEFQGLVEFMKTELTDEEKEEVRQLLTKILSVPSHETPKVRINKEAKEVCCDTCANVISDDYCETCHICDRYSKYKPTG